MDYQYRILFLKLITEKQKSLSMRPILQMITEKAKEKKKLLAILIDPDKFDKIEFEKINPHLHENIDVILVGGSLIISNIFGNLIQKLKLIFKVPVVLFPGNAIHITNGLDAVLFLSLISGRNPEFLIGQQVVAAPILKQSGIEILPTGYMLINGGNPTTANYMSQTFPIPNDKPEIATFTALAGEMLGLKLIFMDTGSGAQLQLSTKLIKSVKDNISIPLIVGGGIRTAECAEKIYEAGADMIVIGTLLEENTSSLNAILEMKIKFNSRNTNQ